ncbi:fasciclin domain-containing protein [Pseudobacteriovorax antillogorgiicola]|uniref:Uncaracterized surface protein containing fasciclin (FAS1) repeats n=1 Tax=Pseudobacteriovorax antillogorgiicola TaxID=1513793 RepID=A0A1Y6BMP8_9BACT|nr:fasciclin domain-containing protein [Pseudobacteriovorax antillogorgiicola]TCS55507.1 putative surface protein with fasciclin (FAS1) repeats [Pseudobacteriovorax antillogorgiicola]SMF11512.1 Uncaracterized surface protein containing fasciclin (FAS1) repeats [Pseudobacteriovorax antillogorgiicola]
MFLQSVKNAVIGGSLAAGLFLSAGQAFAGKGSFKIGDILERTGKFQTLTTALQLTGLDQAIAGDDALTVLAPTDKAFEKLGSETLEGLINNPEKLSEILLYHVIPGEVGLFEALQAQEAATLNSASVSFSMEGFGFFVNDARIVFPNIRASNGVIHAIDSVLLPPAPPSIADIAAGNEQFSTLVAALQATGLDQVLAGEGTFTVFAPTNEAFAKLGEETINALLKDPETLSNILLYHVVPEAAVEAATAVTLKSATMANGKETKLMFDGKDLFINDSKVIATDIMASNGVIHVIDTVLVPSAK